MTEIELEQEPLVLAEDERVTRFDEDDNPEQLAGEDVEDDLDIDLEAELTYPEIVEIELGAEDFDGEPGA